MTRKVAWKPLDKKVIAVAVEGGIGDWSAYIGAVEGKNHEEEWEEVKRNGTKLPRQVAEVLFPEFTHLSWRE